MARGRGRTAAGSRSAGGRAYVLNGFLPQLHPLLQATIGGGGGSGGGGGNGGGGGGGSGGRPGSPNSTNLSQVKYFVLNEL